MDRSNLISKLNEYLPGAVLEKQRFGRTQSQYLWIEMQSIGKVALLLKEGQDFLFDQLENLSVMQMDNSLVLTYFLYSSRDKYNLILRSCLDLTPPRSQTWKGASHDVYQITVPSVSDVWITAEAMEPEITDLFGIYFLDRFGGIKKRAPFWLPKGWEGYPMRKGDFGVSVDMSPPFEHYEGSGDFGE